MESEKWVLKKKWNPKNDFNECNSCHGCSGCNGCNGHNNGYNETVNLLLATAINRQADIFVFFVSSTTHLFCCHDTKISNITSRLKKMIFNFWKHSKPAYLSRFSIFQKISLFLKPKVRHWVSLEEVHWIRFYLSFFFFATKSQETQSEIVRHRFENSEIDNILRNFKNIKWVAIFRCEINVIFYVSWKIATKFCMSLFTYVENLPPMIIPNPLHWCSAL